MTALDREHLRSWGCFGSAFTALALLIGFVTFVALLWLRWGNSSAVEPIAVTTIDPKQPSVIDDTQIASAQYDHRSASEAVVATQDDVHSIIERADGWLYQRQNIEVSRIAASDYDIVVIDDLLSAGITPDVLRAEVQRMQVKPDGSRRLVLAYMSVGAAENQRQYWRPEWHSEATDALSADAPDWLERGEVGECNSAGHCRYPVQYWHPEWQQLLVSGPESQLNLILNAGFDGVYLDAVEAYAFFDNATNQSFLQSEMIALIQQIALHARITRGQPDFLLIPQNGFELFTSQAYIQLVDGVVWQVRAQSAGAFTSAVTSPQVPLHLSTSETQLFALYYTSDAAIVSDFYTWAYTHGYIPFAGSQQLDSFVVPSR